MKHTELRKKLSKLVKFQIYGFTKSGYHPELTFWQKNKRFNVKHCGSKNFSQKKNNISGFPFKRAAKALKSLILDTE